MTFAEVSNEEYHDIGVDPTVQFQTVLEIVKAYNLQGQPLDDVDEKYYSGAWHPFGLMLNGAASKEILQFNRQPEVENSIPWISAKRLRE